MATLALLLRKAGSPEDVRKKLNSMKWSNDVVDEVASLIKSWNLTKNPNSSEISKHAVNTFKKNTDQRRDLIKQFKPLVAHEVDADHLDHLAQYMPAKFSGEDIQKELGLQSIGPEIGQEIKKRQKQNYDSSFLNYKNK